MEPQERGLVPEPGALRLDITAGTLRGFRPGAVDVDVALEHSDRLPVADSRATKRPRRSAALELGTYLLDDRACREHRLQACGEGVAMDLAVGVENHHGHGAAAP